MRYVNYCSSVLVALNTIFMGILVDLSLPAAQQNREPPSYLPAIEYGFTGSFIIEVGVRLALEKRVFFTGANARWNLFDSVVVVLQIFETLQIHSLRNTTLLRLIRVARIIR